MVAERERRSKRPWKVTVAPGAVGCRRVTLATAPEPERMVKPVLFLRQNLVTETTTSALVGISRK